ncbi:hypothetical protein C8R43DRAFT_876461 [Mycena crocata]|nr:hypothetical protein C8R43DRAFT_876461 [Mycena crocata]
MHSIIDHFTPTIHHDTYSIISPLKSDMSGKVIFLSGASKGIGRAAAISFTRAGASGIVIAARSENLLIQLEEELLQIDRSHLSQPPVVIMRVILDSSNQSSVEAAASRTRTIFGKVDVLVNAVAIVDRPLNILESDPEDWTSTLTTNLRGTYLVVRAILPLMTQMESTSNRMIVNLVSASIHLSTSRSTAYSLSKQALMRMSEMLHLDYGREPHNIDVIGFHPGYVLTDLTKDLPADVQRRVLVDSPELAADALVWLAREPRPWLSGRYFSCNWDVTELQEMKEDILAKDKLKFKMTI